MSLPRAPILGLALLLNLLLWGARPAPAPSLRLYPIPPPLTRLSAMGGRTLSLDPTAPADTGRLLQGLGRVVEQGPPASPSQRDRLRELHQGLPELEALRARGEALRTDLQGDAVALARTLGPERLSIIVAQRENLAAAAGEGRSWDQALSALRGRALEAE